MEWGGASTKTGCEKQEAVDLGLKLIMVDQRLLNLFFIWKVFTDQPQK